MPTAHRSLLCRTPLARTLGAGLAAALTAGLALTVVTETVAPLTADATPRYRVETVVKGLSIPWDLTWVGDTMIYDTRAGGLWSKKSGADPKPVSISWPRLFVGSEAGALGLVAAPDAARSKIFFSCSATKKANGDPDDVRVLRWRLTSATKAVRVGDPVVTGLPITSGRHSGCRLRFGPDGKLYVGTGDAATGVNPQNKQNLGGKVLRVNADGSIPKDNPFVKLGGKARYVWTYGHRNVQGLAVRPGTGQIWSVEQGTYRDDEVNLLRRGSNYGYDPVPGYNESVPMTDRSKFPKAIKAKWRSGNPTLATSGGTFLRGSRWGRWEGAMAVGVLKSEQIRLLLVRPDGVVGSTLKVPGISGHRIRTVQSGPDGALWFTTSDSTGPGDNSDVIGRIVPTAKPAAYRAGVDVSRSALAAVRTDGDLYVVGRLKGDRIGYVRSGNDGRSWDHRWHTFGVSSSRSPGVTSSARGRLDVFTRTRDGGVLHTWLSGGKVRGSERLGGKTTSAPTATSSGNGTMDVFARGSDDQVLRNHFTGHRWSGWRSLGGKATAAVGASTNRSSKATTLVIRGRDGRAYRRVVSPTSDGDRWSRQPDTLWSARSLSQATSSVGAVGVSRTPDGYIAVRRGSVVSAVGLPTHSAPAVIKRWDGAFKGHWMVFGRGAYGDLLLMDARSGQYHLRRIAGDLI